MPYVLIEGVSGSRDNAMNGRVQAQVLAPCMQQGHGPAFKAIMSVPEKSEGIPDRCKH